MGICNWNFWNSDDETEDAAIQQDGGLPPCSNFLESIKQLQIYAGITKLMKMAARKYHLQRFARRDLFLGVFGGLALLGITIYLGYDWWNHKTPETMTNITEPLTDNKDETTYTSENITQVWIYLCSILTVLVCSGGTGYLLLKALKKDDPRPLFGKWRAASWSLIIFAWILAIWGWQLFNSWIPFLLAFGFTFHRLWSEPSAIKYLALLKKLVKFK